MKTPLYLLTTLFAVVILLLGLYIAYLNLSFLWLVEAPVSWEQFTSRALDFSVGLSLAIAGALVFGLAYHVHAMPRTVKNPFAA